jgi:hypothetical protein
VDIRSTIWAICGFAILLVSIVAPHDYPHGVRLHSTSAVAAARMADRYIGPARRKALATETKVLGR